jgi:hypothetical protein
MLEVIHQMKLIMPIIFSIANKRRQSNSDLGCNYERVATRACMRILLPAWKGEELMIKCVPCMQGKGTMMKNVPCSEGKKNPDKSVFDK